MKLCPAGNQMVFCGKQTAKNLRRQVKETLEWYEHTEFQKSLRETIRKVESFESEHEFYSWIGTYMDELDFYKIDCSYDRKNVERDFQSLFHYGCVESRYSNQYMWLQKFHAKLKRALS